MEETVFGITKDFKLLQSAKAELPIDVTFSGIIIVVSPLQLENAEFPIELTSPPIVISFIDDRPLNQEPISVEWIDTEDK